MSKRLVVSSVVIGAAFSAALAFANGPSPAMVKLKARVTKNQKAPRPPAPSTEDDRLARAKKHIRKDVNKTDIKDSIVLNATHTTGSDQASLWAENVADLDPDNGTMMLEGSGSVGLRLRSAPKYAYLVHCTVQLVTNLNVVVPAVRDSSVDVLDAQFTLGPGNNSIDFVLQPHGAFNLWVGISSGNAGGWQFSGCEISPVAER